MRLQKILVGAYGIPILMVAHCLAAPLPTLGPVDISGKVAKATWTPIFTQKGVPGLSGPVGQDRTVPARYRVELKDYKGLDAQTAWDMNIYLDQAGTKPGDKKTRPPVLFLQIDSEDMDLVKPGMKIQINAYSLMGDEAGNYSKYEKLKIVERPAKLDEKTRLRIGKSITAASTRMRCPRLNRKRLAHQVNRLGILSNDPFWHTIASDRSPHDVTSVRG